MTVAGVIPAAGRSTRMGEPKLLIRLGGQSVLERLIRALREGGAAPVVVVTPGPEAPETPAIADIAARAGALPERPETQPAEMRESIERGLNRLTKEGWQPRGLALCPGDSPGVTAELVTRLIAAFRAHPDRIFQPLWDGRGRHPVILPWELARAIPSIPAHRGVNSLLSACAERRQFLTWPAPDAPEDLDTPEDLAAWRGRFDSPRNR
jgi:CTP:molybdopterin cytidylyltransferase MocA